MWLGAHVSVAGGLACSGAHATTIRASAIQIFTRNQRTWQHAPLTDDEVAAFRAARTEAGVRVVLSHASYLINLAATDRTVARRSVAAFAEELRRCRRLGVDAVVVHPGAHLGRGDTAGIRTIARNLDRAVSLADGTGDVVIALETTAGQGSSIGHRFEHLRDILAAVNHDDARYGVCVDTCHVFAAGYDLRTPAAYDATWRAFDRTVGRRTLTALHLNDSLRPLGSRRDRHAELGDGEIGFRAFARMARDTRFAECAGVLETPGGLPVWKRDIARLARAARRRAGAVACSR